MTEDLSSARWVLRVVLDTNIILQNPKLDGVLFGQAFNEARAGRFQFVIPALVIREAARRLAEKAERAVLDLRKSEHGLRQLGFEVDRWNAPFDEETNFREHFELELAWRFSEAGATIADYPNMSHEKLVARLLDERKPFGRKGLGYRDALVWATVVELARILGPLAFVSNGSIAFGFGSVWVTGGIDSRSAGLFRVDPATGHVTAIRTPLALGVAVAGKFVWVTHPTSGPGQLIRIDPTSDRVEGSPVEVGSGPGPVLSAGGSILVTNTSSPGGVTRVDPRTGKVLSTWLGVANVQAFGDGSLWGIGQDFIARVNPRSGRTTNRIPVTRRTTDGLNEESDAPAGLAAWGDGPAPPRPGFAAVRGPPLSPDIVGSGPSKERPALVIMIRWRELQLDQNRSPVLKLYGLAPIINGRVDELAGSGPDTTPARINEELP